LISTEGVPRRVRPKFPAGWHVPNNPKLWITWTRARAKLTKEQVYWISSSSRIGKPHAAPVWGIWKSDAFYFETDPNSLKGRNLMSNPAVVVHVQDGLDTVIVEGRATPETNPTALGALHNEYVRKYDYSPDWSDSRAQVVFRVQPRVVHAWRAPRMHANLVNFVFRKESASKRVRTP
jgi:nitroimidazol reductase NimA-like FMN-containing flavoprotein (pyridoxamine 5'-phosphate oxidase superfamily)